MLHMAAGRRQVTLAAPYHGPRPAQVSILKRRQAHIPVLFRLAAP